MKKYVLRPYQQEASDRAFSFFTDKRRKGNGIIVLPTGGGKSLLIADIAKRLNDNVLVFQPSKEILEQNYNKLLCLGVVDCSKYSASCNSKKISKVTFATIGSARSDIGSFKHFKYCLIDECHLFNPDGGMYMEFMKSIDGIKVIGLTATPYRLYSYLDGSVIKFITRTRPRFFTEVLYVCQVKDLLDNGYLSPVNYYNIKSINIDRLVVNSTGQGYTDRSVSAEFRRSGFIDKLQNTIERLLYNSRVRRNGILVFTQFISQSEHLSKVIPNSAVITGSTPKGVREKIISDFKSGTIRVVFNVSVLTTGFDYPELDTVVVARPTRSLAQWYQIVGRCIRPHEGKVSWVIDLCGTYDLFGPVSDLSVVDLSSVPGRPIYCVKNKNKILTGVKMI